MKPIADLILQNGRITTLDPSHPSATEVVIAGVDNAAEFERGPQTKVIDLKGRRVIPGLYDSHLHVIRGGLNYNMELRWEGVPSLQMLREQAARTPAPQRNMKKTSLLPLIAAGLLSILLSSCSSTFTAADRTRIADPVGYIDQTRIADPVDYIPPGRAEGQPYDMHSPHP